MPPTRYRVIERGRRLIVIDNWSGAPVTGLPREQQARVDRLIKALGAPAPGAAPPQTPRPPLQPAPGAAGDPKVLTTQPWLDDKAPRRVRVTQDGQGKLLAVVFAAFFIVTLAYILFDWPGLVVLGFLIAQKGVRKAIRGALTSLLDGFEQVR